MRKYRFIRMFSLGSLIFLMALTFSLFVSTYLHNLLLGDWPIKRLLSVSVCLLSLQDSEAHRKLFIILVLACLLAEAALFLVAQVPYHSRTRQLAGRVITPVAAGQGQHGTASFLDAKRFSDVFPIVRIQVKDKLIQKLLRYGQDDLDSVVKVKEVPEEKSVKKRIETEPKPYWNAAGTILGCRKYADNEELYCVADDVHTLCVGATRSSKTRTVVLQTIGALGLAGENMVLSDPKGELYHYTGVYLARLGYRVITLDFRSPEKSHRFNYLQSIIEAVDSNNMTRAIDLTWDLTASLVGEPKGERIWTDGEAAVIACAILAVVYDNRPILPENDTDSLRNAWLLEQNAEKAQWRNMGNVYAFLANMCAATEGVLPLAEYMSELPDHHPAKALAAISRVAPQRTQGSFYTAALATLRLFTNPNIHLMTSESDFSLSDLAEGKTALYMILPDEKTTYYSLASLFVSQCYEQLVRKADERGGRLRTRCNFILDEFGNFTQIADFESKLTVGGGRGIRFTLVLQSFAQLQKKYGEDAARIIRGNCEVWIYLQAEDTETLKEISDKLGQYTVSTFSVSGAHGGKHKSGSNHSMQLTGRPLMKVDEIRRINRPYNLVLSRNLPALMTAPDISKMLFNTMFGMGDIEHNRRLREEREKLRSVRSEKEEPKYWGIWHLYQRPRA